MMVALGEVARVNPRGESVTQDTSVSFVGMAELDAERGVARPLATRSYAEVSKGYTVFRDHDVLAAKITPCWENGKVGQALLDHPVGVGSTEFHVLRPGGSLDDRYLLHFLRQTWVRRAGESRMTGSAGQKRVPVTFLQELRIPLPPLPEQRRIAAILDHADALRAKRRQVLAHLDALTQSIFHDVFGNELWAATLGELADVQIGPFGSLLHQSDYVSGGVVVINPMHIRGGTLQPDPEFSVTERKASTLELYRLQSGDVVLGRRGEMARAGVAGAEHAGMLCGTGSIILRPRGVDSRFLHAVVTSPRMKEHLDRRALGATLPNLNAAIVKGSPSPRAIGEAQAMFSAAIGRVDQARADATAACAADDELFASLQYSAFRGEL